MKNYVWLGFILVVGTIFFVIKSPNLKSFEFYFGLDSLKLKVDKFDPVAPAQVAPTTKPAAANLAGDS